MYSGTKQEVTHGDCDPIENLYDHRHHMIPDVNTPLQFSHDKIYYQCTIMRELLLQVVYAVELTLDRKIL